MRHVFALAAFAGLMLAAIPASAQQPQSETKAQPAAPEWCGFVDKLGSRVRCGYSSLPECKEGLTDKTGVQKKPGPPVTCLPDPSFG